MSNLDNNNPQATPRSLAEWISFSIALCLLGIVLGLVIYSWVTIQDKPPILVVKETESDIREAEGQFYIPFEATNSGGGTVQSVEVVAQLLINGQVVETGQTQIDFLSGGEISSGVFVFSHDPSQGELLIRVSSYQLP